MDYSPPGALTSTGWRLFGDEFKKNAPVRHWIKYNLRHAVVLPVRWKIEAVSNWVRYRTYDRYHVMSTGLPPGYCSIENKMLHASFTSLTDFVEVELAWHSYVWSDERKSPTFTEKYMPFYRFFNPFRSRLWGLKHLEWASGLDDPSLPVYERCDQQAIDAREIKELYLWWTDKRTQRKEIETKPYSDQNLGTLSSLDDDFDRDAADFKSFMSTMEHNDKLNQEWEKEDTDMFIRLVKIRKALWS